jgi:transposase
MLALEERFMIREMYRKGVSISEIARRTGRDRKTIRQVVKASELAPTKRPRQAKPCKIDPYAPYLEQRMAEGVLNARIMRDFRSSLLEISAESSRKPS